MKNGEYLYEIKASDRKGRYSAGCRTLVKETVSTRNERSVLTTDLVRISDDGSLSVPYSYEMEMINGKIISLSRCRREKRDARDLTRITRYYFQDKGLCLMRNFINYSGKIRYAEKWMRIVPFDLVGMFHYYFLFSSKMNGLLKNALQGGLFLGEISCLEIHPWNEKLMNWKLRVESVKKYRGELLIRFQVLPGFFTRLLFFLLRINPLIDFQLAKDRMTFTKFQEFSMTGRKVIYSLIKDNVLAGRISSNRMVF